jgi:glycosyltransferase involved in cell wall biosynthesis
MELLVDGAIYEKQAYGGISRIYTELLPRMCDINKDLNITILSSIFNKQPLPFHSRIKRKRIFPIDFYLRPRRLWEPISNKLRTRLIRKAIKSDQNTIWHSTYYTCISDWKGKEVLTVYDLIQEMYPDFFNRPVDIAFKKQKRDCAKNADAIISISKTTRKDLIEILGIPIDKIYVIPSSHNPVFRKIKYENLMYRISTDKPFLLYVGKRYSYKNFGILLKSYSLWSKKDDLDLVVIGEPWTKLEKNALTGLKIYDNVHLFTNLLDEDLAQIYNQASAFIHTSLYEGFGIPLLEAMACGCPIVASNIPSTIEVAGNIPIYFEPTDVESLLLALDNLYFEGKESQRVELGLEHVKHYSWERTANETLKVYRAIF